MACEWPEVRLGDVSEVITKGTTPTTLGYSFIGSGVNFVKSESITFDGSIDQSKFAFIDMETHEALKRSQLREGDILFSMAGVFIGKTAVVPRQILPANTNQAVGIVRLDQGQALPRFIDYHLRNPSYNRFLNNLVAQSAQPNLNLTEIGNLPIKLPPLREQRAIAHILGTLDDKIKLNRRMNETLEAMARALFESWFVDFDPVRAKAEGRDPDLPKPLADLFPNCFQDTELGELPEGWSAGRLGDVCKRVIDKIDDADDWQEDLLIDLSRMPSKSIALADWGLGEELTTSVTRFIVKDTLFGAIRPYFHKVGLAPMSGVTNISVFVLRALKADDWPYVVLLASSSDAVEYATRVSKGTKMPVVSWPDLKNYSVPVPPDVQRAAFGRVVAPKLSRVVANIHESRTLAALRDALLPKLLSGEIRVKDAEKSVEKYT